MKNLTFILLLICSGCRYSNKDVAITVTKNNTLQKNHYRDTLQVRSKSTLNVNQSNAVSPNLGKLTCDSLMILLIKSSSIDKRVLKYRAGIDSIKNKIIYLSFSFIDHDNGSSRNGYFLQVDLKKRQMIGEPEEVSSLTFDNKIMNTLVDRNCYNKNADYATSPQ